MLAERVESFDRESHQISTSDRTSTSVIVLDPRDARAERLTPAKRLPMAVHSTAGLGLSDGRNGYLQPGDARG